MASKKALATACSISVPPTLTVYAAPVYEILTSAVIAGSRVPAAIVNMQPAATVSARDETLQQCRPLSHRASRLMWLRPCVGAEPSLIGLKGSPIDEAGWMVRNEDGPLIHRKMSNPFSDGAVFIDVAFVPGLAVGVSASIHRIGEDVMECGVRRDDPTDRPRQTGGRSLQRKRKTFVAEPGPKAATPPQMSQTLHQR